jgi:hypothetical protein
MALFGRGSRRSGSDLIEGFWQWWAAEGRSLAEASRNGAAEAETFATTMTERVLALGELAWELAAGDTSEHVLVLTAAGDPAERAVARRVVLAAPEADAVWSYVDTRPPVGDPESVVLSFAGADVDLARVLVTARMNSSRLDVQAHHPAFADLPVDARLQVTFLALDAALGELDTELWLGAVHPIEFPPLDGFGLAALRSVVLDLRRQHVDEDGNPRWAVLRGETAEGPLLAVARSPLHPLTAPHLDTHVAVVLPYAEATADGLPGAGSLQALNDLQEHLGRELGRRGALVAHQSSAGARTLHVYVDSTAGLVPVVKQVARSWDQGRARVHDMRDPGWAAVAHLRA